MGVELSTFATLPQHTQSVTVGDAQYRVRLTWRERLQGWYFDLYTALDVPVALGRRCSPGWGPLIGLLPPGAPEGVFFVRGPSPYRREDLGDDMAIAFYLDSEIPPVDPPVALTVVVAP